MESISSGVNFLRRRFSSQDIEEDDKSMFTSVLGGRSVQQHQQQAQYQQQQQSSSASLHIQSGPPNSFSLAGLANKVSNAIRCSEYILEKDHLVEDITGNKFGAFIYIEK
ncbi:unnamed protein product [Wuchereria bancrofti]|uniref:Uncharacterized protein n=1 Tax=Wuchereria bancrofti TaxID=6293 RepID=A0A3P7DGV4_WUCBA|nr:unnamed protein product [Wuchereria bancrofti]